MEEGGGGGVSAHLSLRVVPPTRATKGTFYLITGKKVTRFAQKK